MVSKHATIIIFLCVCLMSTSRVSEGIGHMFVLIQNNVELFLVIQPLV